MNAVPISIIDVRGLWHTYLAGTPLETLSLRDVCFQACAGETIGIIGPTGSGKSTLLQHFNGLLRPQHGQVFINGVALHDPRTDLRRIRQQVGLVFQSPEDQLFERYAGDDVAFGPRNLGLKREDVRERVREAMETCGLPFAFKDRLTLELSQGERRRLALAGILALRPQVLLLDEPTAGLDPQGRVELLRTLRDWRKGGDRAIILASHNMEDVVELSTRVYVLVEGQVVLEGTPLQVFSRANVLLASGLAVPPAMQVVQELRRRGYDLSGTALTTDEAVQEIEALFHA